MTGNIDDQRLYIPSSMGSIYMKLSSLHIVNYKSIADSGTIQLGQVNVLIGRNNAGKSSFIHAAHLIQRGALIDSGDVRIGSNRCDISYHLTDTSSYIKLAFPQRPNDVDGKIQLQRHNSNWELKIPSGQMRASNAPHIPEVEPDNFIYTYLSKRKVTSFDQVVNRQKARAVSINLQNIVSKVDRLANPDYPKASEYDELCRSVLGFRVSSLPSDRGHQAGIPVGNDDYIAIESMGEGVSSLLGLITDICVADGNLFLIEELENDIHPEGLKMILRVIVEKSATNQFIVSTHSNIVMRYLGSAPGSKVFNVELEYMPGSVPTSTIREIGLNTQERMSILRQLGYELYDFDLWDGWLILEESSAEVIIRDYLIPWFTPRLSRVRTVSANGTSKLGPVFEDFNRLFLFTHLQPQYKDRAWVVADGDSSGRRVIQELAAKYSSWPSGHFQTWTEANFESYYPPNFAADVADALSRSGQEKRAAKKALLDEVKQWCDQDSENAKAAFEASASEVITLLRECEKALFAEAEG